MPKSKISNRMPNLILEYTDNLDFDPVPFFEKLHHLLAAEVDSIRYKGLKSRAIKLTEYHMAEGHLDYKMVQHHQPLSCQRHVGRKNDNQNRRCKQH